MTSMLTRGCPSWSAGAGSSVPATRRAPGLAGPPSRRLICQAERDPKSDEPQPVNRGLGLGDLLGPIGLTVGGGAKKQVRL